MFAAGRHLPALETHVLAVYVHRYTWCGNTRIRLVQGMKQSRWILLRSNMQQQKRQYRQQQNQTMSLMMTSVSWHSDAHT